MCFIRAISSGFLILNTQVPSSKKGVGTSKAGSTRYFTVKKMLLTPIQAQDPVSRIKRDTTHPHDILSLETSSYKRYIK